MAKADPKKQDIETRLLDVDTQNFRIGDFDNVRDAYRAMIDEEGDDLVNLAADIVEVGLSLGDLLFVCPNPDNPGHFIVLDGNRRFTSLKLLGKPVLAEGTSVHKKFLALSKKYKQIRKLSTVVFPDKEAAMPWIRRRHQDLGGRGTSQWKGEATGRADAFAGHVRASRAVIDFVKEYGQLPAALERVLSKRTTNLDRVLQMPYMKSALGVTINKDGGVDFANGKQGDGLSLLLRMLRAMGSAQFNVNDIRFAQQRHDFIDSFSEHNVLAEEGVGDESTSPVRDARPAKKVKKPAKRGVPQADRKQLALKGKEGVLPVRDDRLIEIYDEACKIDPEKVPNGASLLTRVFLELSTDYFLQKKVPLPTFHKDKGRKNWRDQGIKLEEKISAVLKELDPNKNHQDFKQIRQFKDKDAIHSIVALHDYVHGLKAKPDPREVKRIWERWHPYFEHLFAALS